MREYWIIDPMRQRATFNRLDDAGLYRLQRVDVDDCYRTPLLPRLVLHVPTLWRDPLPNVVAVVEAVHAMMDESG